MQRISSESFHIIKLRWSLGVICCVGSCLIDIIFFIDFKEFSFNAGIFNGNY